MKFTVTIEEIVRHTIDIEAPDAETAKADAVEILLASGEEPFNSEVQEREVAFCMPAA